MKSFKIKIYKKQIAIILLAVSSLALWSCNDDSIEEIRLDRRLEGMDKIEINHVNPITGEPYTSEELAALEHNPAVEEVYMGSQPIDLTIWTEAKPLRIEIEENGGAVVIEILENPVEGNGGYELTWSTTLDELGLPPGISRMYNFYVLYDDVGVDDFPYNSENKISYTIIHKAAGGAPLVTLRHSYLDIAELKYQSVISDLVEEAGIGTYAEFDGGNDLVTISEEETDLDFTHNEDFSVSLWVKTTSTESDPSLIGDKDWGSGGNKGFVLAYLGDDWKVNIADGAGNRVDADGALINDGAWHHLAVTFARGGSMSVYQDGAMVSQADISSVGDMNSELPIRLSQDGTGNYGDWFEGLIGGAVISDYVLSEDEIEIMAGKGSGVQLRTASNISVLDLQNGASENLVEEGMPVAVYNGVDAFSTIVDNGRLDFRYEQDFSMAWWVNTTSSDSDPEMLADQNWGSSSNTGFSLAFKGDKWRAVACDGNGGKADVSTDGIPFNDGNWHLLMATFDRDGDLTIYQDGENVGSVPMAAVGSMDSGFPIRIAQDGPGTYGQFFEGKIGRTMIFDYAVSADQALELFTE